MTLRELHSQCLKIKYKNKFCSKANLFVLLTSIITIIVPLLTVYYNDDIWNKTIVINKQPTVKFNGYYQFQASTSNSSRPIFCSNFPFSAKYDKDLLDACSYIKAREVDVDEDGKIDLFEFTIHGLLDNAKINSVLLILSFTYELEGTCKVNMDSIITTEHLIKENTYEINDYGTLEFSQLVLVHCFKFLKTVVDPSIVTTPKQLLLYKPQDLLEYYTNKNLTTAFKSLHTSYKYGTEKYFTFNLKMRIPQHTVYYKSSFTQSATSAIIQYIAFYVFVNFIISRIKKYVFDKRVFLFYEIKPDND